MIIQNLADTSPALSLVLPLYNEEEGLRTIVLDLLAEINRWPIRCELVLVNNGSIDGTARILKDLEAEFHAIRVVHVPLNMGYGWGIICGLRAATAPIVGFMCGDGQIMPEDVGRVYRRLVEENLDVCKVVRVVRTDGLQRKIMSGVYNTLFRAVFRVRSLDINGTPKLMRRRCYEELNLTSKDWFIDAEVMIKAVRNGYRIGEVPVEFRPRAIGRSHVRLTTAVEFLRNMVRHRLGGW
jgi:glycosyltransferase involved in cell wall biosynthesis